MEPTNKSNGLLIALVIIVILAIGAVYMWQKNSMMVTPQDSAEETVTNEDANALNSLEQDLNNLDSNPGVDVEVVQ